MNSEEQMNIAADLAADFTTELLPYPVNNCTSCHKPHTLTLRVRVPKIPISGLRTADAIVTDAQITYDCPVDNKPVNLTIPNPQYGLIEGVESVSNEIAPPTLETTYATLMATELLEWVKNSRTTAQDFCKTMITVSSGAVAVYFAVLKYLGFETVVAGMQSDLIAFTIVPPILFFAALIVFVLALNPTFASVTQADFPDFRRRRLKQLNQFSIAGIGFFVAAILLAIIAFRLVMVP